MHGFESTLRLRSIAADIGEAYRKYGFALAEGRLQLADSWEMVARDLACVLRAVALDTWRPDALEAEAVSIYARWDSLNEVMATI